jgi:transposase-like protein
VQGPVIADSARKHEIPDEDILHAWRNQIGAKYHGEGSTMAVCTVIQDEDDGDIGGEHVRV